MPCSRSPGAAALLFSLAPLSAASILTVGPAGSGAQFTEIQAAIDAAVADDVILVQPGTYQVIVVDKPLRILGDGTGLVRISGPQFGVKILDIAAGEELVLAGVEAQATHFSSSHLVLLLDCPGTVVLHDVSVSGANLETTGVRIENCERAVLLDSVLEGAGSGALSMLDSEVWIANAEISGALNTFGSAAPGVSLDGSTLHVWRSHIQGSDNFSFIPKTGGPGGSGIRAIGSTLDLFGGPNSRILGGRGAYDFEFDWSYPGGPGLDLLQDSHARIQADIFVSGGLSGSGSAQALGIRADATSTSTLDPKVFPTLVTSVQQVQLGSSFGVTLRGNPGGAVVLWLSLRTGPTKAYHGVDGFSLLDRANLFRLATGVLPPSGVVTVPINVPTTAALLGSTLIFQAVERFPNGFAPRNPAQVNGFAISNPALVTITG